MDAPLVLDNVSDRPALLDQLTHGYCPRGCRRAASIVISVAFVLPMVYALVFLFAIPLIHRFSERAQHEIPVGPVSPVDFKPWFPVDNPGQWALLVGLGLACLFNALVAGSTFILFMRRRLQQCCGCTPRHLRGDLERHLLETPVAVVVPCYLPNEQTIIWDTINHILHRLVHDGPLTLHIVYNTPTDLPIEQALHEWARTQEGVPPGRRLNVLKVEGSTSKAENLNAAFADIDDPVTAIYDADHHPDPKSLAILLRKLQAKGVDCVQGSTYIRNTGAGFMSRVIDAEFFVTYFIYFMSLQFIARTAFFGGSNALWRTAALRGEKFEKRMQTEDIDFATRQLLKDKSIRFCPEARSGELAPSSFRALYKQRLRWAMGWEQVTLCHIGSVWRSNVGCSKKLGLTYLLPMRWLLAALSMVGAIITPILTLFYQPLQWPLALDFLFTLGFLESSLIVACTLLESIYHEGFIQCIFVTAFMLCSPLYLLIQVTLLITSLTRIAQGKTGQWVVTSRSGGAQPPPTLSQAERMDAGAPSDARASDRDSSQLDNHPRPVDDTILASSRARGNGNGSLRRLPIMLAGLERYVGSDYDPNSHVVPALGSMRHTY